MKSTVYVAIALAAGLIGFAIYQFVLEPRVMHEPTQQMAKQRPPQEETAAVSSEQGMPTHLPEFTLMDREGTLRSIQSWPGKSLIVNFWATWCGPCRREIPLLKEIQETRAADGFQVVGIAVDFREDVLKYADEMQINYPLLIGEQDGLDAIGKFGLPATGFPFTVFTDEQSRIVLTHLGEITETESKVLLEIVSQVNRGELTPDSARVVAAKQLAELGEEVPAA